MPSIKRSSRTSRATAMPPGTLTVETPFGAASAPRRQCFRLVAGMPGFESFRSFALLTVAGHMPSGLWLMQSLEDRDVSFPVLPLGRKQRYFDRAELVEAAAGLSLPPEACRLLLMMIVRRTDAGLRFSANLRAPIVLDPRRRIARQHAFNDDRRPFRRAVPAALVSDAIDAFAPLPIVGTLVASLSAGVNSETAAARR